MKKKIFFDALSVLFSIIFSMDALSWDNEITHRDISEASAKISILSKEKGDYLKNLGLKDGIGEYLKWGTSEKTIEKWIAEGAFLEDEGTRLDAIIGKARYNNHFHNPLKSWEAAGLSDIQSGESSVLWAQDSERQSGSIGGDWSWQKVRLCYYYALTVKKKDDRQAFFACTFQGLGYQIHLIQDAAQPAHVRNDAHPMDGMGGILGWLEGLETWAKKNHTQINFFTANPILPNVSFSVSYSGYPNFVPIAQLIDTDRYDGLNASAGINQGLAEYTNANFASDETIFTEDRDDNNKHYFPYPRYSSASYEMYEVQHSPITKRIYLRKTGDGEYIEHFATAGPLLKWASFDPAKKKNALKLDSVVYKDYASLLIPRAVGYSAGLLNYFFRGSLDVVADSSGSYRIVNLSDEDMSGTLSSFRLFYDDADGNRFETPLTFLDESGNQLLDTTPFSIPAKDPSPFLVQFQPFAQEPTQFVLVFKGRLGAEDNAVVGSIVGKIYLVFMPIDPGTRQTLDPVKQYYHLSGLGGNRLNPIATETEIPFALLDDGAYWDTAASSWTKTESNESLGVPVGTGGPQYMAKYWDAPNKRVRFVLNTSYEKEAYRAFNFAPVDPDTGRTIKSIYYVNFIGSPLLNFGAYEPNTGWMEYTGNGLLSVLSPPSNPQQRFFPLYKSLNFNDAFVETPYFTAYNFNGSRYEAGIPKDPDAPKPAIVSADRPDGADYVKVSIPEVFSTYVRPKTYWRPLANLGSSGLDYYRFYSDSSAAYDSGEDKCIIENNNCGNMYDTSQGDSSINTTYDMPYNFNSHVRVHINDNGLYYEKLFINGQLVETSPASADSLKTHYQILAVYKDTAVIRKTGYVSEAVIPLEYAYANLLRVVEKQWNWTSGYYIFVKGRKYEIPGTTAVSSRLLTYDYNQPPAGPRVDYLAFETVEDITGYHMDRIFISETFDGNNILIAFDEYKYNGGKGFVHQLKYEQSDSGEDKSILFYGIPASEIQNADHEAARVGRQILLFRGDGTFKGNIEDPLGLNLTIGSVGMLN